MQYRTPSIHYLNKALLLVKPEQQAKSTDKPEVTNEVAFLGLIYFGCAPKPPQFSHATDEAPTDVQNGVIEQTCMDCIFGWLAMTAYPRSNAACFPANRAKDPIGRWGLNI